MISMAKPIFEEEEFAAVKNVLKSGMLVQGEEVYKFEESFAKYNRTKHAIATNSGTSALHTMLLAAGIKKGDEIITVSFSFVASSNAIVYCGAKPIFVDVGLKTFNINPSLIESKITPQTKGILVVHLFGNPCDMKPLQEIAEKHNLILFEDCCQSHGAEFNGKKVGSFGHGAFSFYPSKNMTTGEGGIITTDSDEVAHLAREIRQHGTERRYYYDMLGFNYRMTNIGGALGLVQLQKLDKFNQIRITNALTLTKGLKDISSIELPCATSNCKSVFNQYTIKVNESSSLTRDELKAKLAEKGISSDIYYPVPIHKQTLYKEQLGYNLSLPITEKLAGQVLSIPIHPSLKRDELEYIIDTMHVLLKR